jgi:transglutaminase-like putative cysteine protease
MRIRIGYDMTYEAAAVSPIICLLNVHQRQAAQLEQPDYLRTEPVLPLHTYTDNFGNLCTRLVAPAGRIRLTADAVFRAHRTYDPVNSSAIQHEVADLPPDTLEFLLGSRYCETDLLSNEAWRLFGSTAPGWARVQAICDFVNHHIRFDYQNARPTRTAAQTYAEATGVCRDYTHLAIAFARGLNIPARYCSGYISDVGLPLPYATQDFCAWMEVYLGGRWWVFDPRNNAPRMGRILMAQGRDAADVPLVHFFGQSLIHEFKVWVDELPENAAY